MNLQSHHFDNYELTPVKPEDLTELAAFVAADPDHAGRVAPEFFAQGQSYRLADEQGTVLYIRLQRCVRLHIQFGPGKTEPQRARIRAALTRGVAWLKETLRGGGNEQMIFESSTPALVAFCLRRLGFRRSANELIAGTAPAPALAAATKNVHVQHQSPEIAS